MRKTISMWGSVLLVWAGAATVAAHHSPSAIFDMTTRISVTGTLTKIDWINPHIVVTMDAKGSGGPEHWTFESNPPSWYRSVGLARADFAKFIGQMVTVEGVRARDRSLFGYMQKITLPGGTTLELINSTDPK
ncbi:MAG: hypothetical protein HYU37_22150 [Acidobacteria bacterium]|nr:hypothetical protein [Acidobacteriota bacterium]